MAALRSYSTPPSYFNQSGLQPQAYGNHGEDTQTQSNVTNSGETGQRPNSSFQRYLDICRGFAYLAMAGSITWLLYDQRQEIEKTKRQVGLMKRSQKDMLIQMQNYKKKAAATTVRDTQKHTMIEGKMQMHIALLRQQLLEQHVDPVTIDRAIEEFEEKVRMATSLSSVTLYVPGEPAIKSLIPDANEYLKKL